MPIARIITSMPELSGGLVRDLNSRGFEVHIISPEQSPSGTADLEIRLEAVSRPVGVAVRASEIPASTATSVPDLTASRPPLQQEDIWTMLASFDADASTQDITTVDVANENRAETESQEAIARMHALAESSAQRSEPEENAPSVTEGIINPADRAQVDSLRVDPELVPSMFNFSSSGENAETEQESATSSNRSPWRGSELRKTNVRSWDSRSPRVAAAAAGCAVLVILMVLTFAHSHATPNAINPPAQETRTAVPFHGAEHRAGPSAETAAQPTVPIKPAVLVSNVSSPSKTTRHGSATETAVAEDTIVRYGSAKKTPQTSPTKPAIRYYSDMD